MTGLESTLRLELLTVNLFDEQYRTLLIETDTQRDSALGSHFDQV